MFFFTQKQVYLQTEDKFGVVYYNNNIIVIIKMCNTGLLIFCIGPWYWQRK